MVTNYLTVYKNLIKLYYMDFNKENFEALVEQNKKLINTLQGIIDGCVHPEIAVRAVMVDLKPIRKILQENKDKLNTR